MALGRAENNINNLGTAGRIMWRPLKFKPSSSFLQNLKLTKTYNLTERRTERRQYRAHSR